MTTTHNFPSLGTGLQAHLLKAGTLGREAGPFHTGVGQFNHLEPPAPMLEHGVQPGVRDIFTVF